MTYDSRFASRGPIAALASGALLCGFLACTAEGSSTDVVTEQDAGATDPNDGVLPEASTPIDSGVVVDAGADARDGGADASKDAGKDATVDSGKPSPNPGDLCSVANEIFKRQCGACGTQEAVCLANDDGSPGGVVTGYSPCTNELDGGCMPGTTGTESCGNCGTRARTCNKYCAWVAAACTGEPANSCTPTSVDLTSGGCGTLGTFRTRQCGSSCTWSGFSATCEPLSFQLTIASVPTETASAIYPLRPYITDARISGSCAFASLSATKDHPYVYVRLDNPTSKTATLSAWNTFPTTTATTAIATAMTVYATTTTPTTEAERKACVKTVSSFCPTGLPCGNSSFAGLTGTNAFTIPPNGSVLLFFQSRNAISGSSPSTGDVKLVVRTDSLQ